MTSSRRSINIARPRQIAMYICKAITSFSYPEIGKAFGGKDHTTVMHAVKKIEELKSGEIGFIITGIKNLSDTKVGDTICEAQSPLKKALPGFKPSKPVVFCGLFPVDSSEYQKLKDGLAK